MPRLFQRVVFFGVVAVGAAVLAVPSLSAMPAKRLRVSANHHFLVYEDGRPFFYLGDTAWELFHRLNREEADRYLKDRAAKGFTVVQAVVLAELDGLGSPNPYGELPLADRDPARPNEKYFQHVDWIVDRASELGLVVGMLPTWGDKWNRMRWGKGPEIFTPENAAAYGEWLGRRYVGKPVIWIVGGDRPVETERHRAIVTAMARGLRKGDGGEHLITFHPTGGCGSAQYFHDEEWLDFNMRQNGHEADFAPRYAATLADYQRTPAKPVLDGEPLYEDHPIAFDAKKHGHSVAADIRRPLYWNLFGGAFGHTYGHHSVWQMYSPDKEPINGPLMSWIDAKDQPGAGQVQNARWLLESRPFLSRIPDDSVIIPDTVGTAIPGAGQKRLVATRDDDGSFVMVYSPAGRSFKVRMSAVSGREVAAWWFNPRDGRAARIGTFPNLGERLFTPPDLGEELDWVLVLDDQDRGFPPPGTH